MAGRKALERACLYFSYVENRKSTFTSIKFLLGTGPVGESLARVAAQLSTERRRVAEEHQERLQLLAATRQSRQAIEAAKQKWPTSSALSATATASRFSRGPYWKALVC